jgi:dCMP deaminase
MRLPLEDVLMMSAELWAQRGTCNRLYTGAVIAREGRILSTGYNGVPSGLPHCNHNNPDSTSEGDACTRAVHAEANAIAFAARQGIAIGGSTMYATHQPCSSCAQIIINSGIEEVWYKEPYRKRDGVDLLHSAGVVVRRYGLGDVL